MVVLKHPIAADIVLVSPSNTENPSFICHDSSAKLRNFEVYFKRNFLLGSFHDIVKVDEFRAPFKVMYKLLRSNVALFEDKSVLKFFRKSTLNINVYIVCNFARKFVELSFLHVYLLGKSFKFYSSIFK